jgi:hypothetical protein
MDTALVTQLQSDSAFVVPKRRHRKRKVRVVECKARPLTRGNLDKRTLASKQFSVIVDQIRADCSVNGTELSVVQLAMVEAFAGLSVQLDALNTEVLLGKPVDRGAYCQLITTLVRVGSRLGVKRRPKEINQTLASYLDNPERPEAPEDGERPPRIGCEPLADGPDDGEGEP